MNFGVNQCCFQKWLTFSSIWLYQHEMIKEYVNCSRCALLDVCGNYHQKRLHAAKFTQRLHLECSIIMEGAYELIKWHWGVQCSISVVECSTLRSRGPSLNESGSFRPRSSSPPRRFAPAAFRPRSFRPWSFRPLSRFAPGRFAPRRNINLFAPSRNINLFCWNLCE